MTLMIVMIVLIIIMITIIISDHTNHNHNTLIEGGAVRNETISAAFDDTPLLPYPLPLFFGK